MNNASVFNTLPGAVGDKLSALGIIAAKVAHELNSPLDGSQRFLNLAMRIAHEHGETRIATYLSESLRAHQHMQDVVRELLDFVRSAGPAIQEFEITALIQEVLQSTRETAAQLGVTMETDLCKPSPRVRGDALFQVFHNIVRNALDAMPQGGVLRTRTAVIAGALHISFEDTGCGLPDVEKIFEPFFTTKARGRGTGLGLALSRDIVIRQYAGTLTARQGAARGAIFEIEIPAHNCVCAVQPNRH